MAKKFVHTKSIFTVEKIFLRREKLEFHFSMRRRNSRMAQITAMDVDTHDLYSIGIYDTKTMEMDLFDNVWEKLKRSTILAIDDRIAELVTELKKS